MYTSANIAAAGQSLNDPFLLDPGLASDIACVFGAEISMQRLPGQCLKALRKESHLYKVSERANASNAASRLRFQSLQRCLG